MISFNFFSSIHIFMQKPTIIFSIKCRLLMVLLSVWVKVRLCPETFTTQNTFNVLCFFKGVIKPVLLIPIFTISSGKFPTLGYLSLCWIFLCCIKSLLFWKLSSQNFYLNWLLSVWNSADFHAFKWLQTSLLACTFSHVCVLWKSPYLFSTQTLHAHRTSGPEIVSHQSVVYSSSC